MVQRHLTNPVVEMYEQKTMKWARKNKNWSKNFRQPDIIRALLWELTAPFFIASVAAYFVWRLSTYPLMWVLHKIW